MAVRLNAGPYAQCRTVRPCRAVRSMQGRTLNAAAARSMSRAARSMSRTLNAGPHTACRAARPALGRMQGRTLNACVRPYAQWAARPHCSMQGRTAGPHAHWAARLHAGPHAQCILAARSMQGRTLNAEPYGSMQGRTLMHACRPPGTLNEGRTAPCRAARSMQGRTLNAGPHNAYADNAGPCMQGRTLNAGPHAPCRAARPCILTVRSIGPHAFDRTAPAFWPYGSCRAVRTALRILSARPYAAF